MSWPLWGGSRCAATRRGPPRGAESAVLLVRSEGLRLFAGFLGSARFLAEAAERLLARQLATVADEEQGLSLTHVKLLTMVRWSDRETVSDLALYLGVTAAAASKSVDRLVHRGLVRRHTSPGDRRVHLLALTDAGRRFLEAYDAAVQRALQRLFGAFVTPELVAAQDVMDRIAVAIAEGQGPPVEPCSSCALFRRDPCGVGAVLERRCFFEERMPASKGVEMEPRDVNRKGGAP